MIEIATITIVVWVTFLENNKYYPQFFLDECLYKIQMKSNNELKEIYIKNFVCYYFDGIINGTNINFNNTLLDKKIHKNISYKTFV